MTLDDQAERAELGHRCDAFAAAWQFVCGERWACAGASLETIWLTAAELLDYAHGTPTAAVLRRLLARDLPGLSAAQIRTRELAIGAAHQRRARRALLPRRPRLVGVAVSGVSRQRAMIALAEIQATAGSVQPISRAESEAPDRWCNRCREHRIDDPCELCRCHTSESAPS